jgi:hypothetical protein
MVDEKKQAEQATIYDPEFRQGATSKLKIYTLKEFTKRYEEKSMRDKPLPLAAGKIKVDGRELPYEDCVFLIELKDCEAPSAIVMARRYEFGHDGEGYSNGIATLTDRGFDELSRTDEPMHETFSEEDFNFFMDTFWELSDTWDDAIREALQERSKRITAMHEHIEKNSMYGEF